jgi:pimeloyl-ACP methyl ester carboxylesterase/DNA-binding SARP family transcriptional activator
MTGVGAPAAGRRVRLALHGYPGLAIDAQTVPLALKRAWALVACLVESERRLSRDAMAALLWPDADGPTGRARLRRLTHQANATVGFELFRGDADTVGLALDGAGIQAEVDVVSARRAALAVLDGGAGPAEAARLLLPQSQSVLAGFDVDSDAFEAWLSTWRQEHERLVVRALQRLAEDRLRAGRAEAALEAGQRLLQIDPFADGGHAAVIAALGRLGRGAAMEAAYDDCARLVRDEFGVRPSAAVEAAYAGARAGGAEAEPAPLGPALRYARTADGAVAYATLGDAEETMIVVPEVWSHIETSLADPHVRRTLERLAQHVRVVLLDRRGTGLSERIDVPTTPEAALEDVLAVVDTLGVERAWLLGTSVCAAAGIELAVRHPERVHGLVLVGASACGARRDGYPWALDGGAVERWIVELQRGWGRPTSLDAFAPSVADDPDVQAWWTRTFLRATTPKGIATLVRTLHGIDVRHRLGDVGVPTLVVHRRGDRIVRAGAARYLAAAIPGAELRLLEGDDHFLWHGDSAALLDAIEDFLGRHPMPARRGAGARLPPGREPAAPAAAEPAPPIEYVRGRDGVRLAWSSAGSGATLVKAATWLSHLEFDRESPVWGHLVRELARDRRCVRYDERGCGLSDRDVDDLSFDSWVRDLETVVDAAAEGPVALLGMSQGAPIAIAYAVAHPERVSRVVLHGGYARGRLVRSRTPEARAEAEAMARLAELGWGSADPAFRQYFTNQFIPGGTPEQHRWFNELERISTSPENAARFMREFAVIDVVDLLGQVRCPALVLHSRDDLRVPVEESRLIAAGIPDARFVEIASRNHLLLEDEPGWRHWLVEVRPFLAEDEPGRLR